MLLIAPNLEEIEPETGLIKEIPKFTFELDILRDVETPPLEVTLEATLTTGLASYNFDTALSTFVYFFIFVSYFSFIDKSFILLLSLLFNSLSTFSADLKSEK